MVRYRKVFGTELSLVGIFFPSQGKNSVNGEKFKLFFKWLGLSVSEEYTFDRLDKKHQSSRFLNIKYLRYSSPTRKMVDYLMRLAESHGVKFNFSTDVRYVRELDRAVGVHTSPNCDVNFFDKVYLLRFMRLTTVDGQTASIDLPFEHRIAFHAIIECLGYDGPRLPPLMVNEELSQDLSFDLVGEIMPTQARTENNKRYFYPKNLSLCKTISKKSR